MQLIATLHVEGTTATAILTADVEPDSSKPSPVLRDFLAALDEQDFTAAASPPTASKSRGVPHLVFALGATDYAVPLGNVREVSRPSACTPLRNVPEWLLDVANVCGDVVSMVDLRRFLDDGPVRAGIDPRMLVVTNITGDLTSALLVDRVRGLRELASDQRLAAVPAHSSGAAAYLVCVSTADEGFFGILDIDRLLTDLTVKGGG